MTQQDQVMVLGKKMADETVEDGFKFEGFWCDRCCAWHPWEGYADGVPRTGIHCERNASDEA